MQNFGLILENIQTITLPVLVQSGNLILRTFELFINFLLAMLILFFMFRSGKKIPPIIGRAKRGRISGFGRSESLLCSLEH